jgi:hypothetical protein
MVTSPEEDWLTLVGTEISHGRAGLKCAEGVGAGRGDLPVTRDLDIEVIEIMVTEVDDGAVGGVVDRRDVHAVHNGYDRSTDNAGLVRRQLELAEVGASRAAWVVTDSTVVERAQSTTSHTEDLGLLAVGTAESEVSPNKLAV